MPKSSKKDKEEGIRDTLDAQVFIGNELAHISNTLTEELMKIRHELERMNEKIDSGLSHIGNILAYIDDDLKK